MTNGSEKITRALSRKLVAATTDEALVQVSVFVAIDHESLPLSSFAARAAAKNAVIMNGVREVMTHVQKWEATHGRTIALAVMADEGSVNMGAPRSLIDSLAATDAVAVLDVPETKPAPRTPSTPLRLGARRLSLGLDAPLLVASLRLESLLSAPALLALASLRLARLSLAPDLARLLDALDCRRGYLLHSKLLLA